METHRDANLGGNAEKPNKRSGVLLDRDGVVNEEVNYLSAPEQVRLVPGASSAIRLLNLARVPVIIITNQSGVARGYFTEDRLKGIHAVLQTMLASEGAFVDRFYYCPHHPQAALSEYRMDCECRKPKPGLVLRAARDFNLDLSNTYFVGDTAGDIAAGRSVGCRTVLVRTGYGARTWQAWNQDFVPDFMGQDLLDAVRWILAHGVDNGDYRN